MDRYYVKEGFLYPKQIGNVTFLRPTPQRLLKIIDRYNEQPVHQLIITDPEMWATEVYELCNKMNEEHKAYHLTLFQFLYVSP